MTLAHVQRGQPLKLIASDWNAMVDAARAHLQQQLSRGPGSGPAGGGSRQTGIVLVRNDSGADQSRFAALGIDGPIILPADNTDEFKRQVALKCVVPTADHFGKFVVLDEPLTSGGIGRAYIDGVCPASVNIVNEADRFADMMPGTTTLRSGASGAAGILWAEAGTGTKWAIIRLGAAPQTLTRVRVKEIFNNHLRCRNWDDTTEGDDDFLVAKPFKLRHLVDEYPQLTGLTTIDINTVTATGTVEGASATETWLTTPNYVVDDNLFMAPARTGLTIEGHELTYIDANTDARRWAMFTDVVNL